MLKANTDDTDIMLSRTKAIFKTQPELFEYNFDFAQATTPWDTPLSMFQFLGPNPQQHELSEAENADEINLYRESSRLFRNEMQFELEEELRSSCGSDKTEFDWPSTCHLSKVDCLKTFNRMKQIILEEISKCDVSLFTGQYVQIRRHYLQRRLESLQREKIRRLKIYEASQTQEDIKTQLDYVY